MRAIYVKKKYLYLCVLLAAVCLAVAVETNRQAQTALAPYHAGIPEKSLVTLTVNVDWGNEYLPELLRILDEQQVKATFFLTGRWAAENPKLARQIAEGGHELGNHGYHHNSPNACGKEEIMKEIKQAEQAIFDATGYRTALYAPPSGESEPHVIEAADRCGYRTILWSVDTIDWQNPDRQTLLDRVESKLTAGSIILAHPTAVTVAALPQIIAMVREKGWDFGTVSQNID
ncbi:MAG: polysaccharide deacetylase family protein [Firmicutes bacterium]|nr:polysaccharide deacetylase family protein [Bacillota bacterium]